MMNAVILVFGIILAVTCGLPLEDGNDDRIVGGRPARIEQFPYQVSVHVNNTLCGGSIISNKFILTAAHCTHFFHPRAITVRAGSVYYYRDGVVRGVENVFEHKFYYPGKPDYDISLLLLQSNLTFSSVISPIKLPLLYQYLSPGSLAVASGWGETNPRSTSENLRSVELPLMSSDICKTYFGRVFTGRMLCTVYVNGDRGTCLGDAGGPLVYNGTLIGVTSIDTGCGKPFSAGVYISVPSLRTWIEWIAQI